MRRRDFIQRTAAGLAAGALPTLVGLGADKDSRVQLPFENGDRSLVSYPQKRPLIRLTSRPPQLETPFAVFNEGVITPNDAFFVRYHLGGAPPARSLLEPDRFRLAVKGQVEHPLDLSLAELKTDFQPAEVMAVNQCSGNGRGLFSPRVTGGQLYNGAMGNARWVGVPLKDVLARAEKLPPPRAIAVDDDKDLLPIIVASLESASLATTGCADARTALDALQENHFDVIVLDIGLPDMNGLDMCDHIQALPKHGQTPIVFLSSDDSEHNRERGVIKGATEFIAKPCNMFELTLKAHTWALKNRLEVA